MAEREKPKLQMLKVLALSDDVDQRVYNHQIQRNFPDIDLVISCGDLPYFYLEFVVDMLNVPTFFVHGNHDPPLEIGDRMERSQPLGAENLDDRVVRHRGFLFAGFEGSMKYSNGIYEYTQLQMWLKVLRAVPKLLLNRLSQGRFLDVLVTHSPAWGVGDHPDPAHQGFKAFRWLVETFKPKYHLHGHIHIHDRNQSKKTEFGDTLVINAHVYQRLEFYLGNKESDE